MIRDLKENAAEAIIGILFGAAFLTVCWALPHLCHWMRGVLQ